jgi:hypothetical protein
MTGGGMNSITIKKTEVSSMPDSDAVSLFPTCDAVYVAMVATCAVSAEGLWVI